MEKDEWLSKRQAAARMGLQERRILQLAAAGTLRSKRERDPVSKQMTVYVHVAEVDKYIESTTKPTRTEVQTIPRDAGPQLPERGSSFEPETMAVIVAHLAKQLRPLPPNWMTLDAAEQYCGLDWAHLQSAIKRGELPARRCEPAKLAGEKKARSGSCWRVCRRDLDALQGVAQGGKSLHA
jgi:hypothetical protein